MTSLAALWLPLLLSAVAVFIVSSILNTVLPWHHGDFKRPPRDNELADALRAFDIPPGDYMMPRPSSTADWKSQEFKDRLARGPNLVMTVFPSGQQSMTGQLVNWFVYCIVVGLFGAYVAARALGPGAPYLEVFRFVGTVTFAGYGLALWQGQIWYRRDFMSTVRSTIDALIYACVTAGMFGWLWPQ